MTAHPIQALAGPRIPHGQLLHQPVRYLLPALCFCGAAGLLLFSSSLPYWQMVLHAPQYPKGLTVVAYLNHLTGDVQEIDGLNHYIGMRPLNQAAQFERTASALMVGAVALLLVAAIFIHNWWAALLALPALLFPLGFLG